MTKKKFEIVKPTEIKGRPMFDNGKLGFTKKTAEELLKEMPMPAKLAREIAVIESHQQNSQPQKPKPLKQPQTVKLQKPNSTEVNADVMIAEICKNKDISTYVSSGQHVIKFKKKTICWISNRKYGVAVSVWGKGGKDFKTLRIALEKDMKDMIEKIKKGDAK